MTPSQQIRKLILEQSKRANVGHIGSALSIVDIIVALYFDILRISSPVDPERDRFILSKGHAALALYAAFFLKGWLSEAELNTYCGDASLLGSHPEFGLKGVDFSTGSLGLGLSIGVGAALAGQMKKSERRAFVLISDAECNEGSLWEAAMFAAHHKLANLIAILDLNRQQALGYTRQILDLSPIADRWRAFNWDVNEVDGHNVPEIAKKIRSLNTKLGSPHVLICNTIFGKGVSFMENQINWHYLPMSDDEFQKAMQETLFNQ